METTKKKSIFRKFSERTAKNTTEFDETWTILANAISMIQQEQKTLITHEELFTLVEKLCRNDYSNQLYQQLKFHIKSHVESVNVQLVAACQETYLPTFLNTFDKLWNRFCHHLDMIRNIFLFLDRTYRVQNSSAASIRDCGLEAFREIVIKNTHICDKTIKGILEEIESERMGNHINRNLLKSLLKMFSSLQVYEESFEPKLIKASTEMYENESRMKCQELHTGDYLKHIKRRIEEENERADFYLEYSSIKKLIAILDRCFITNHLNEIVEKDFEALLNNDGHDELSLMYKLLQRVDNGLFTLKGAFSTYIKKIGESIVMNTEKDKTLVQELITLKERLDKIITNCFESNDKYVQALKDSFDYFINKRPNGPAELMAKFMDSKLKLGNKECSEEQLEEVMDKLIVLFRFIHGKDVFEAFYKKDLAKRLLLGKSASVDSEKSMLSKLKNECGAAFTQKLEGMFKDIETSKEFAISFKQFWEANYHEFKIEFGINILTMVNWPTYTPMPVIVPSQMENLQEVCSKFYMSKYNGRTLQWQHSLAYALVKATFKPHVQKELDVTFFQTLVLLLFNDADELSFNEIEAKTKIASDELKRTLQSLACGKFRILLKSPRGKEVDVVDRFQVNTEFNDRLHRIRISQIQMKETASEHRQTESQVMQDRQYQIDAAIVRIMKSRKSISHTALITEIYGQLRFPVKSIDLKKRIESLIERDYMCRDKVDQQIYNYVS